MQKTQKKYQQGQALVSLLVFSVMALTVAAAATAVMINTAQATSISESRITLDTAAESGVENALIRLIRDPDYEGEVLNIGDVSVTVTVSGETTKTITSVTTQGFFRQVVQATVAYIDNRLTVTSWHKVY